MNRREMFRLFPGVAAAAYGIKETGEPKEILRYRGFATVFTGWRTDQHSPDEVAQYFGLGHPSGIIPFVVSCGDWGFMGRGSHAPVSWHYPCFLLNATDSDYVHEKAREEMYGAMHRLIDHYHTLDHSQHYPAYGPFPNPPLVHPEIPNYYAWRDLRVAGVYDEWLRESIRSRG